MGKRTHMASHAGRCCLCGAQRCIRDPQSPLRPARTSSILQGAWQRRLTSRHGLPRVSRSCLKWGFVSRTCWSSAGVWCPLPAQWKSSVPADVVIWCLEINGRTVHVAVGRGERAGRERCYPSAQCSAASASSLWAPVHPSTLSSTPSSVVPRGQTLSISNLHARRDGDWRNTHCGKGYGSLTVHTCPVCRTSTPVEDIDHTSNEGGEYGSPFASRLLSSNYATIL